MMRGCMQQMTRRAAKMKGVPLMAATFSVVLMAGFGVQTPARSDGLSPETRALLVAASPQPVEITLGSAILNVVDETSVGPSFIAADNRLVLRVPAPFVTRVLFSRENPRIQTAPGASALTLSFWSQTFDPVVPDRMADNAACRPPSRRPCAPLGTDGGRVAGRHAAGEYQLNVVLHTAAGAPGNRRYNMLYMAGLATRGMRLPPCEFREDPVLGMLVGRTPEGQRIFDACNVSSSGMLETRTGRFFDRATFLMREVGGTPKFGVRCRVFTGPEDGVGPSDCELVGYFGIWPMEMVLLSNRVGEWNATFDRVREFLAQHVVSRSD